MAEQNKSPIVRSWKTTIGYIAAAVIAAAISALLFKTIASGAITIGISLIPAVLAIILMVMAMSGAGVCQCPGCGSPMSGLSTGNNDAKLCTQCHHYFEGKDGMLWATDESRVADTPLYASPLPEQFGFPDVCCVCGKPPTHRQPVSMTTQNTPGTVKGLAVTGLTDGLVTSTSRTRTTVEVPHCDEHKDGASLTGTAQNTHIRFRSYPYLRSFCEMNKTTPG